MPRSGIFAAYASYIIESIISVIRKSPVIATVDCIVITLLRKLPRIHFRVGRVCMRVCVAFGIILFLSFSLALFPLFTR